MRLAARLAAHLGVEIVDCGESFEELLADDRNLGQLGPAMAQQIAEALLAGAREGDVVCIGQCILARSLWREPDLEEIDWTIASYGRFIEPTDAAIWVRALLEHDELELLDTLVGLDGPWTDEGRHAVCVAVLPLGVALDGDKRSAAAAALEAIARHHRATAGDLEVVVPRLCELLFDDDAHHAAANALAAIGDRRAIEPLIESLERDHPSGAIYALRELNAAEAVPALAALCLRTTNDNLRNSIYYAVAQLGPAEAASAVAATANPDEINMHVIQICQAGAERGDAASLEFLQRARRSGQATMRAGALRAIGRVGGPNMFAELCRLAADDPDPEVRGTAVLRLRELRDPRAFDALTMALRRGHHGAATALGELGDARGVPYLVEALGRDSYYQMDVVMKSAVLHAIGDIGVDASGAWDAVVELLNHRSEMIQHDAALTLQHLRPGCMTGSAVLVRRLERSIVDTPDQLKLVPKLGNVARRGVPVASLDAARAITVALVALERHVPLPEVSSVVEAWRAWIAASAS